MPHDRRPLWRTAGALTVAFAVVTCWVALDDGPRADESVLRAFSSATGPTGDVARVVDDSTGYPAVGLVTSLLVLVLLRLGKARTGALLGASVAGAMVGASLLKRLVGRPRPELAPRLEDISTLSYPSGHAAATAALAVAVALTAAGTRRLLAVVAVAVVLVAGTGAAQLVLALHHPSDVVGGWLWAGAWTTAVWACCHRPRGVGA